jgi:hypothetical protein
MGKFVPLQERFQSPTRPRPAGSAELYETSPTEAGEFLAREVRAARAIDEQGVGFENGAVADPPGPENGPGCGAWASPP